MPEELVLIVVGAHPRAEVGDRPWAYELARRIDERIRARSSLAPSSHPTSPSRLSALVCTDLWYLNDRALRARPSVSVGAPGVNAFTASLADRLPTAFVVDGKYAVQFDHDSPDAIACCWGADPALTGAAVEAFCARVLDEFLDLASRARPSKPARNP